MTQPTYSVQQPRIISFNLIYYTAATYDVLQRYTVQRFTLEASAACNGGAAAPHRSCRNLKYHQPIRYRFLPCFLFPVLHQCIDESHEPELYFENQSESCWHVLHGKSSLGTLLSLCARLNVYCWFMKGQVDVLHNRRNTPTRHENQNGAVGAQWTQIETTGNVNKLEIGSRQYFPPVRRDTLSPAGRHCSNTHLAVSACWWNLQMLASSQEVSKKHRSPWSPPGQSWQTDVRHLLKRKKKKKHDQAERKEQTCVRRTKMRHTCGILIIPEWKHLFEKECFKKSIQLWFVCCVVVNRPLSGMGPWPSAKAAETGVLLRGNWSH